jgi:hypothetical protein
MTIENQIFARCGTINRDIIQFDAGLFFRNLLLFDNFILETIRLKKFHHLVNHIGFEQTIELLNYKHIKIRCMASSIESLGQSVVFGIV